MDRGPINRYYSNEGGAVALEFAIVASVFIALILGTLQIGWILQIKNKMSEATDSAIRAVMMDRNLTDSDFEAQIYNALSGYNVDRLAVDAGKETVDGTEFRTISVDYDIGLYIPFFSGGALNLNVSQRVPIISS